MPSVAGDLSPPTKAAIEGIGEHDHSITPLHPAIAQRFLMLPADTAEMAQQAVASHGNVWYRGSGLFDDGGDVMPTPHISGRNNAFSDPAGKAKMGYSDNEEGGNMPVVEKVASAGGFKGGEHASSWKEDMGTVGSVFDSLLAEYDHGRI